MGDKVNNKAFEILRLSVVVGGISTGLWLGNNVFLGNPKAWWLIFVIVPVCGLAGWLLNCCCIYKKPSLLVKFIDFFHDLAVSIPIGFLIGAMVFALTPLKIPQEAKNMAWVSWIFGVMAMGYALFSSAPEENPPDA